MQELQTENEQPLLVVRYVGWKVLYGEFWNLLIILILIGLTIEIFDFSWHGLFLSFVSTLAFFTILYAFFEMLLFKEFRFYNYKLEQMYYFFGVKTINLRTVRLLYLRGNISSVKWYVFRSIKGYSLFYKNQILLPLHLLKNSDFIKINEILSLISNRSTQEITEVTMYTGGLNPFIKPTQKGTGFPLSRE